MDFKVGTKKGFASGDTENRTDGTKITIKVSGLSKGTAKKGQVTFIQWLKNLDPSSLAAKQIFN